MGMWRWTGLELGLRKGFKLLAYVQQPLLVFFFFFKKKREGERLAKGR